MRCPQCGRETPPGDYCIHCGTRLRAAGGPPDARRWHAYAANPHEHVWHLSIISTLFPHLAPRRALQARWLLLGGAVVVFLVALSRLVPLAIVLAALLVPVLYLLYFFDALIYEDEPLVVLALTFVAGVALGAASSLALYRFVLSQERFGFAPTTSYVLLTGVGLPLLGQALMLAGPVVLFVTRRRFAEVLDGLTFGAAAGLGFAAAQSVTYSWLLIAGPFQRAGADFSWALPALRIALLTPLLDAATTGLICAALWLRRDTRLPARRLGWVGALPVAIALGALGQVVPAVGADLFGGQVRTLVWYAVVVALLLLALRTVLHVGLLEKAQALAGGGAAIRCPHCGHLVPADAFCAHCGVALRALAKRARRHADHRESEGGHASDQA